MQQDACASTSFHDSDGEPPAKRPRLIEATDQRSATAQIVQRNEVGAASFPQSIAQDDDNCNDYAEVSEHICLTSYIFDKSICTLGI